MKCLSFNSLHFVSGLLLLLFGTSLSNAQSLLCGENDAFEIDCTPTLYQVYANGNDTTRLFSYDNSSGVSVTIDYAGEYYGTINATGYSAVRNRAYGIGCRNEDIIPDNNGVCPNPQFVEISMDYNGQTPEAKFCSAPLVSTSNCQYPELVRIQQGDVVPCVIDGDPSELYFLSGPNTPESSSQTPRWVNCVVLSEQSIYQIFNNSFAAAACYQFNLPTADYLNGTADFAFDPDTDQLFHVRKNGQVVITSFNGDLNNLSMTDLQSWIGTSLLFNESTVRTPTGGTGGSGGFQYLPGADGLPSARTFGAVYVAKDENNASRLLCTENNSGRTFRSSKNTSDILSESWVWQEIDVDTKSGLQNNDGFSCPTATWVPDTTTTCDGPLGCSFNLQPGTAYSEDSCRFVASILTEFDVNGNPEPVPYDCKWVINYGGGTLVYEGYNLNSIEFEIPKSSYPHKEICLTLTCPTNPAQTITCCQDLECSGTCNVSQDDIMECNLYRLPGDGCCHSIHPSLPAGSSLNPEELCLYIDWGDGGPLEFQSSFNSTYTHCYETSESGCNVPSHEITVYAFCCPDQEDFLEYYNDEQAYPYAMSCSACANCCPVTEVADDIDCYIRNAFWVGEITSLNNLRLKATQFLGPDMLTHYWPYWWAPNNDVTFNTPQDLYTDVVISATPGNHSICRSIIGLAVDGSTCSTETCHDVAVFECYEPDLCAEDLDGDGLTGTSDLLIFLSAFGAECN